MRTEWNLRKVGPTATERFMDALCSHLPGLSDEDRVRLEEAFYAAVQRVAEGVVQDAARREEY